MIAHLRHLIRAAIYRVAELHVAGRHELAAGARRLVAFLRAKLAIARAAA